jgi:Protein of unknown function (DUF3761)
MSVVRPLIIAVLLGSLMCPVRGQNAPQSSGDHAQQQKQNSKAKCTETGTYVNSKGETVKRPESCSSAPEGATAQCRDGSYSFSRSHRGTCSHHGGVAKWL